MRRKAVSTCSRPWNRWVIRGTGSTRPYWRPLHALPPGGHREEGQELFHPPPAPGALAAPDGLVAHAEAIADVVHGQVPVGGEVVHVPHGAPPADHGHRLAQGLGAASGADAAVRPLLLGEGVHLAGDVPLLIIEP